MSLHRIEAVGAGVLLVASIVGWPVSALTWARHEPPTVLGLSWVAITLTAMDLLKTSRVHKDQDDEGPGERGRCPACGQESQ